MKKISLNVFTALMTGLCGAQSAAKWVLVDSIGVEYRLTTPARNACQVEVQAVKVGEKKKFVVHSRYFPHKARRAAVDEQTDEIVLAGGEMKLVHITGCEGFASVEIQ